MFYVIRYDLKRIWFVGFEPRTNSSYKRKRYGRLVQWVRIWEAGNMFVFITTLNKWVSSKVPRDYCLFKYKELSNIGKYGDYVSYVLAKINDKADKVLLGKFMKCRKKDKIRKKYGKNVCRIKGYILPNTLEVFSSEGIRIPLRIASNPAITIKEDRVLLYIRVASIGGDFNVTSIVHAEARINEMSGEIRLTARELLYPIMPYENVEDPRVDPLNDKELFHVRGFDVGNGAVITFRALLNEDHNEVLLMEPIRFREEDGEEFVLRDYRDTFSLNDKYMIVRPFFRSIGTGGIFIGPRDEAVVSFRELNPISELLPQEDEIKTGGNAVAKISSNEYLLIYHCVDRHRVYYTYAAILSDDGELLSMTKEPIIVPSSGDYVGRRPGTVFVCGVAKYKDEIIITAGKDDEIVLIYSIHEDDLFEKLENL